ncbi:MAG: hypothetical protein Q4C36_03425 [Coriobacteriia bacterium]|nr:hypothetical protein [Coriobacteriia bacterium]
MTDELKKELGDGFNQLDESVLDSIAGGYIYHDAGDPAAHRKETFYVLDDTGNIILRLEDIGAAKHWAGNLRTSKKVLSAAEFETLRRTHKLP